MTASAATQVEQTELIRYQLDELNVLKLEANEWENFNQEHQRLHHGKSLIQAVTACLDLMQGGQSNSADQLLQQGLEQLQGLKVTDPWKC